MPERIDGFIRPTNPQPTRQDGQGGRPSRPDEAAQNPVSPGSDSVSLTESARRLSELSSEAAAGAAVDFARVETVRQALDEGLYEIDARKIAERLLALEDTIGE